MADTQRTQSTLLTSLFQDGQADGAITPQDVRDFIVSATPSVVALSMDGNATETAVAVAGTHVSIGGTWTEDAASDFTTVGGVATYTGVATRGFFVMATFDMTAAGNNKLLEFQLEKNGTATGPAIQRFVSTGTDVGAAAILTYVSLTTNDTIELVATNVTDTVNLTVKNVQLIAVGFLG